MISHLVAQALEEAYHGLWFMVHKKAAYRPPGMQGSNKPQIIL